VWLGSHPGWWWWWWWWCQGRIAAEPFSLRRVLCAQTQGGSESGGRSGARRRVTSRLRIGVRWCREAGSVPGVAVRAAARRRSGACGRVERLSSGRLVAGAHRSTPITTPPRRPPDRTRIRSRPGQARRVPTRCPEHGEDEGRRHPGAHRSGKLSQQRAASLVMR
jgi:hypothetical protein